MRFVYSGARNRTAGFLSYSMLASIFAVLIGGFLIANEFQQGTIRMLIIRPKTRSKILMGKFMAALIISIGTYVVGSFLNLLANGICFGFSDFGYPIYTVSGEVNFFPYYIPKFLACIIPIIFTFAAAFLLSVIGKNVVVSIIVPLGLLFGSDMFMLTLHNNNKMMEMMNWIGYTPVPYLEIHTFFDEYSLINYAIRNCISISLGYGISLLLALSAAFIIVSILVFNKRDISN